MHPIYAPNNIIFFTLIYNFEVNGFQLSSFTNNLDLENNSTLCPLVQITGMIKESIDNSKSGGGNITDKLEHYGIRGNMIGSSHT